MRLSLVPFICSSLLVLAGTPSIADEGKSAQERSLDAYISFSSGGGKGSVLVSVKDGTSYKLVTAILHGVRSFGDADLHLSIRPTIDPPRTTGDPHAAIGLSGDSAELYVTDAVPLEVTMRLSETVAKLEGINDVVLRSIRKPEDGSETTGEDTERTTPQSSDDDPFSGPSTDDDPFND